MPTEVIIAESPYHLKTLVNDAILTAGNSCDLNHIDVSGVTDMARLFKGSQFDGDVSKWNVSGVRVFDEMFRDCPFSGDLSHWNVSSAMSMRRMFQNAPFNKDISNWNVEALVDAGFMFDHGRFSSDVSAWRPINLKDADHMFHCSRFNGDVSGWKLPNLKNATAMFDKTPFNGDLSSWHLPKVEADYATRLVPGPYTGVLPHIGGDFNDRHEFYRSIFKARRGSTGLTAYLEDSPFNTVHLDVALHSAPKTPGVSPENMAWVCNVKAAGLALGLDDNALWAYAFASFKERGRETVVANVDFSMMGGE